MNSSDSECYESADEEIDSAKDVPTSKESKLDEVPKPEEPKIDDDLKTLNIQNDKNESDLNTITKQIQEFKIQSPLVSDAVVDKVQENNSLNTELIENTSKVQIDGGGKKDEIIVEDDQDLWGADELNWGTNENRESTLWGDDDDDKNEGNSNSWGDSWGNWGVSNVLNTATQGVSSLTSRVTNVIDSTMGIPAPEELVQANVGNITSISNTKNPNFEAEKSSHKSFGFGNLVSGVSQITKLVETTGTKVISSGLDTLETIGRRTMEVLQDGDPGLRKKRAFLTIDRDKPVLSQLLREAKEKSELEATNQDLHRRKPSRKTYETLFDDHQGLVHLEALEMLSKQCDIKLQSLLEESCGDVRVELQETMEQVKELCELSSLGDDSDENSLTNEQLKSRLDSAVVDLKITVSYSKLIETWQQTESWLDNLQLDHYDEEDLHEKALIALAQLTAMAVEQFHRCGELLLVKEHRSTADEADSLVQLTVILTTLITKVSNRFSDKLNEKGALLDNNNQSVIGFITNVFFEAANSSSYIQNAFHLLLPVLQIGAV